MICFVYNEIKYLPHTIDYYKKNGCDIYVLDNYSNDGTYEWLIENNIPCHRIDTDGAFDLRILQKNLLETLPKLNPDWVIYGSADLYYITESTLSEYIEKVDSLGYNQISFMCYGAINTGEEPMLPLHSHYYYAYRWREITMVGKYEEGFSLYGDKLLLANPNPYLCKDGMVINYGACKPVEEQKIKLERRRKAWERGMSPYHGVHFEKGEKINWKHNKEGAIDLRKNEVYKYILKIN